MKLRSQSLPWVSGALRHKMNRHYKALKKAKKEPNNEELWIKYRRLRNEVTADLRREKSHYFLQLANRQRVNTRQYWKILNKASGKELEKTEIRAIRSPNGTLVTNDKKKAEILIKQTLRNCWKKSRRQFKQSMYEYRVD